MIVRYFNNTKPINIVILSVLLSLLMFISFFLFDKLIFSINFIGKFILIILSFIVFNKITKGVLLTQKKDFGILFYVLLSGLFYVSFLDIKLIVAHLFLIFAINQLNKLRLKEANERKILFNFGFLIGVSSIFYSFSSLFLLLFLIAIVTFNKISVRSFIIPVLGLAMPLFFVFVLNNLFEITLLNTFLPSFIFSVPDIFSFSIFKLIVGLLIFLSIISVFTISLKLNATLLHFKAYFILILTQLLIAIVIVLFSSTKTDSEIIFIIFPLSVLLGNYLPLVTKKWIANSIILLLTGLLILNYSY